MIVMGHTRNINMPKELHAKLKKQAKKKGLSGERAGSYIYGTLDKVEKKLYKRKKN